VLDVGSSENTMTFDESFIKLEASTSDTETITEIQNYLDSFNKEIEGNELTHEQTGKYYFYLVYFILTKFILYLNKNNEFRWELSRSCTSHGSK